MTTCNVCTNKRTLIRCFKCDYGACKKCIQTYLVSIPNSMPKCMACNVQWTLEFIAEHTDKQFHNRDYRDYRAKLLMERERSLLPETQPYVLTKEKEDAIRLRIDELRIRERELRAELTHISNSIYNLRLNLNTRTPADIRGEEKNNSRFIGHCPVHDCKGFLNDKYVCGLCTKKACKKCRQIEDEKHECKEEDIATAKLLSSETKSCPKCLVPIFKISGCDQMFCTNCNTAFSWNTGQIEMGRVHNPHYYEWQRKTLGNIPREQGDVRCGGLPSVRSIYEHLSRIGYIYSDPTVSKVGIIHRLSTHIRHYELQRYTERVYDNATHRDLRIAYLSREITQEHWQSALKKREKQREKHRAIHMILIMFVDTIDTLLSNILNMVELGEVENLVNVQLENLHIYTNEQLQKIASNLKNHVPIINEQWHYES